MYSLRHIVLPDVLEPDYAESNVRMEHTGPRVTLAEARGQEAI